MYMVSSGLVGRGLRLQIPSEVAASTVVSEVEASTSEDACTQMQAKRQEFVT